LTATRAAVRDEPPRNRLVTVPPHPALSPFGGEGFGGQGEGETRYTFSKVRLPIPFENFGAPGPLAISGIVVTSPLPLSYFPVRNRGD
jgi:hypothetical protein